MKNKNALFAFFIFILLSGCGDTKRNQETITAVKNVAEGRQSVQERGQELSERTPMSNDHFEQWRPAQLLGLPFLKASEVNLDADNHASYTATYKKTAEFEKGAKEVNVIVQDCAGTRTMYAMYASMLNGQGMNNETSNGYENIEDFDLEKI